MCFSAKLPKKKKKNFFNNSIDTGPLLPKRRLSRMLPKAESAENLIYFRAQSLPHLLALIVHPPKDFVPQGTSLVVIDSISAPFPSYFPNTTELRARASSSTSTTTSTTQPSRYMEKSQTQWLINRKWNVMGDLATSLAKLAATCDLAVLVLNQTHTRIRGQRRAILSPAVAGRPWEAGIHARIVLYRDLDRGGDRFAEVIKRAGKVLPVRLEDNVVPFLIREVIYMSQE